MVIHEIGNGYCGPFAYGSCLEAFHVSPNKFTPSGLRLKRMLALKTRMFECSFENTSSSSLVYQKR